MQSPFKDKFGIPRQPGLASQAKGVLKLDKNPDFKHALKSLEEFSHIWIIFVFHEHGGRNWKPSIRPPRLGGNRKVGVLASRSPHRPNPIGISAVALDFIDFNAPQGPELHISGLDLLDGTPVLDIKPYIPYADSLPEANPGWAGAPIPRLEVRFSDLAEQQIHEFDPQGSKNFRQLIIEILEIDPRPAYQKRQVPVESPGSWGSQHGFDLLGKDIKYQIQNNHFLVTEIL